MISVKDAIRAVTATAMKMAEFMSIISTVPDMAVKDNKVILNYYKDCEIKAENGSETVKDEVVPKEVQEGLKKAVMQVLKEQASPVYVDGAVLFCIRPLNAEEREDIVQIMTNPSDGEGEDEDIRECWEAVNSFIGDYFEGEVQMEEEECIIDSDVIYLNFSDTAGLKYTAYSKDDTSWQENDIRQLAKAINHLLEYKYGNGFRYITDFTTY